MGPTAAVPEAVPEAKAAVFGGPTASQ